MKKVKNKIRIITGQRLTCKGQHRLIKDLDLKVRSNCTSKADSRCLRWESSGKYFPGDISVSLRYVFHTTAVVLCFELTKHYQNANLTLCQHTYWVNKCFFSDKMCH